MKLKKTHLATIVIVLTLPLLIFAAGQIDFQRIVDGMKPVFAGFETIFKDGGSVEYTFLGYTVTDMNQLTRREDGMYLTVGPVLEYRIPGLRREQISLRKWQPHVP